MTHRTWFRRSVIWFVVTLILGLGVLLPWRIGTSLNDDHLAVDLLLNNMLGIALVALVVGGVPGLLTWYVSPLRRIIYETIILIWQKDRRRFGMDRGTFFLCWLAFGSTASLICGWQVFA